MKFAFLTILALQVCLDRRGFSPNALDGQWGRKSAVALATYCAREGLDVPESPEEAYRLYFANEPNLWTNVVVTASDIASLTAIPTKPAEKARLSAMGYTTLQEKFAECGHLTLVALKRLNPDLLWPNPPPGSVIRIPYFPEDERIARAHRLHRARPHADVLRVSLSRFEITVFDEAGKLLALYPCSIAADKNKLPPPGEIHVCSVIQNPNYTYKPDYTPPGEKVSRYIYPPGPNNPVGVAWLGLTLPGYGIHGTPTPERIGRAESHGCFRLANWNALRLYHLCDIGVSVVIEN